MTPEMLALARQVMRLEGDAMMAALTLAVKVLEHDARERKEAQLRVDARALRERIDRLVERDRQRRVEPPMRGAEP
jgi:cobalamin biosynthesis protein CobD/CbiB